MPTTATPEQTTVTTVTETTHAPAELPRELAYRRNDGIRVALLWDPSTDATSLLVEDMRTGVVLEFDVAGEDALNAFHHPFAYAP